MSIGAATILIDASGTGETRNVVWSFAGDPSIGNDTILASPTPVFSQQIPFVGAVALTFAAPAISNQTVSTTVSITGGTVGVIYKTAVTVHTSSGQVLIAEVFISIGGLGNNNVPPSPPVSIGGFTGTLGGTGQFVTSMLVTNGLVQSATGSGAILNVAAFGASPSASAATNNAAFAAAFTALPANGGTIIVPPGFYSLSAPIVINKSSVILQGSGASWPNGTQTFGDPNWSSGKGFVGTVLQFTGCDGIQIQGSFIRGVVIRDIGLQGSGSGSFTGINNQTTSETNFAIFQNVLVGNFATGLSLGNWLDNQSYSLQVAGCTTGISLPNSTNGTQDTHFWYTFVTQCGTAVNSQGAIQVHFHGGSFGQNTNGFLMAPALTGGATDITIENIYFISHTNYAIKFDVSNGSIAGPSILKNYFANTGDIIVFNRGASSNVVNFSTFDQNDGANLVLPVWVTSAICKNNRGASGTQITQMSGSNNLLIGIDANNGQGGLDFDGILVVNPQSKQTTIQSNNAASGFSLTVNNYSGATGALNLQHGAKATINQVALTNNVATLTLASGSPFMVGQSVTVSGLTHTQFNGTFTLTAVNQSVNPTVISYALTSANVAAVADSGTVGNTPSGVTMFQVQDIANGVLPGMTISSDGSTTWYGGANVTWNSANFTLYTAGGTALFLRDTLNGRMQATFVKGTAGNAQIQILDNLSITGASGQTSDVFAVASNTANIIEAKGNNTLGFFAAAPVAQPTSATNTHTVAAGATTNVFTNTTFDGSIGSTAYTVGDLVAALKNLGLIKS